MKLRLGIALALLTTISLSLFAQAPQRKATQVQFVASAATSKNNGQFLNGQVAPVYDTLGGQTQSWEVQITGTAPATVTITIAGCMPAGTCQTGGTGFTSYSATTTGQPLGTTGLYDHFNATVAWTGGDSTTQINVNSILGVSKSPNAPSPGPNPVYDVTSSTCAALGNSNGAVGNGADDAPAIANCINANGQGTYFLPCGTGSTTRYYRWATPQVVTAGGWKLTACGSNNSQDNAGNAAVEIIVDMANGTAPALTVGGVGINMQEGPTIDASIHVRDIGNPIAGGHSPGGFLTLLNVANAKVSGGGGRFLSDPLTTPTNPAVLMTCTNTGGTISTAATIFEKLQWVYPTYAESAPSPETSVAVNTVGCSAGATCSCTPNAPASIPSKAIGTAVYWFNSAGNERRVGLPYVNNVAGNAAFTTNLVEGGTNNASTPITTIPTSGPLVPNTYNQTGGAWLSILSTTQIPNCGFHNDTCVTANANRNSIKNITTGNGQGNTIDINVGTSIPWITIVDWEENAGNCPNTAGACFGLVANSAVAVSVGHMDGPSTAGASVKFELVGSSYVSGVNFEGENAAATHIQCTTCKGAFIQTKFAGVGGTGAPGYGFAEDSTSTQNFLFLDNSSNAGIAYSILGTDVPCFSNGAMFCNFQGGTAVGLTGTGACATISPQQGGTYSGAGRCTSATAASTLTLTLPAAKNGYSCYASDVTSGVTGAQNLSSTTTCRITFATVTLNDVINFGAIPF